MSLGQYVTVNVQSAGANPYGVLNPGPSSFGAPTQVSGPIRDEGSLFPRNTIDAPAMAPAVTSIEYTSDNDVQHCKGAIVVIDTATNTVRVTCNTALNPPVVGPVAGRGNTAMQPEITAVANLAPVDTTVLGVLAETVMCRARKPTYLPVAVKGVTEVYNNPEYAATQYYGGQRVYVSKFGLQPEDPSMQPAGNGNRRAYLTGVVVVPGQCPSKPGSAQSLVYID